MLNIRKEHRRSYNDSTVQNYCFYRNRANKKVGNAKCATGCQSALLRKSGVGI